MAIKKILVINAIAGRAIGYDTDTGDIVFLDGDTITGRIDGTGFDISTLAIDSEAQGDIMRRGASGWERLAAATNAQMLIGDGTDLNSVAVSGDVTIDNTGAVTIANDAVTSAKVDESLIQRAEVELTAAEVKALAAAPITIVADAAVAAGSCLVVNQILLVLDEGGTPYDDAAADGDIVVEYSGGNDIVTFEANNFIDAGADALRTVIVANAIPVASEGIQITNDGAEFTGGDGTLNVHVWYSIVDVGL